MGPRPLLNLSRLAHRFLSRLHPRQPSVEHLVRRSLVVLHRAGPLTPYGGIDTITILTQLLQAALIVFGENVALQRLEIAHIVGGHADHLPDARAVIIVNEEQVPKHALLHIALALAE